MSLISEALRKAHLEALQQDRDQRRFYMNHGGRPGHADTAKSRTSVAIGILASLCVVCAGALLYLTLDRTEATPSATSAAGPSLLAAQAVAVTPAVDVTSATKTVRAPAPLVEKRAIATMTPDTPRSPKRARERAAKTASAVVAPPAAPRVERDGFRAGETYGSPVLGPLGTEVVLTGITALRGQHVAIINGSTVRAGTAVGPFVVEEIEARRIRLKYVDISFFVVQ